MYGEHRDQLIVIRCRVCGQFTAIRLDGEDLDRHVRDGIYVQHCFPYLSPADRELFITQTCASCWARLCVPSSQFGYD